MDARTLVERWLEEQAKQGNHLAEGGLYALDMRQLESLVEKARAEALESAIGAVADAVGADEIYTLNRACVRVVRLVEDARGREDA